MSHAAISLLLRLPPFYEKGAICASTLSPFGKGGLAGRLFPSFKEGRGGVCPRMTDRPPESHSIANRERERTDTFPVLQPLH